jgi:hypothetical protein
MQQIYPGKRAPTKYPPVRGEEREVLVRIARHPSVMHPLRRHYQAGSALKLLGGWIGFRI